MDVFCESCGYKNQSTADFCENCGKELNKEFAQSDVCEKVEPTKVKSNKTKKKGKIALIVTSIVLSVAIVVGSVFGGIQYFLKKKAAQPNPLSDYNSYVYLEEGFTDVKIVDEKSAIEAVASVSDILGIKNPKKELSVIDVNKFENETFYRIQQSYEGIPVYGRTISLACYKDGSSAALTSNYLTIPEDLNTKPKKSLKDAQNAAKEYLKNDDIAFEESNCKLVIYETKSSNIVLAYYLTIGFSPIIVDANSGEVLQQNSIFNNITAEVKSKNGKTSIGWQNNDGSYHLYNDEYKIEIFDVDGIETRLEKGEVHEDFKNYDIDTLYSKNGIFDKDAILAMNETIAISQFYENLGFSGFERLHVAINDNFDDGMNAAGAGGTVDGINGGIILLGSKFDFSEKDCFAHEYTHAVTQLIARLGEGASKKSEALALAEAYSDIFGILYENSKKPDWKIIHLSNLFRHLKNPSASNTYANVSEINKQEKYDQYTLSTIISHSAYLMWNGIDGSKDKKIDGDTLAKLWYKSIMFLHSNSDFSQCRNAVELSAKIMLRNGELTEKQYTTVSSAFEQVGVDRAVCSYKYTTKNEFKLSVLISDDSIQLDKNSRLQSNFNLKVLKLNTNGLDSEEIMNKEKIADECSLKLENGYYKLLISDAKNANSIPLSVLIKVDGNNDLAYDHITLYSKFTSNIITKLEETSSTKPNTNSSTPTQPNNTTSSTPSTSSKPSTPSNPSTTTSNDSTSKPEKNLISQEDALKIAREYWGYDKNDSICPIMPDGTEKGKDGNEYYRFNLKHKVDDGNGDYHWSTVDIIYVNTQTGEIISDPSDPSYKPGKPSPDTNKNTLTQSELLGEWKMTLSVDSYCDNILKSDELDSEDKFAVEFFREFFESGEILATVVFKSDGTFDMISDESLRDIFDEYVEEDSDYELDGSTLYFEVEEGDEYGFDCEFNYTYDGNTLVLGKTVDGTDHPYTGATFTKIK